MIRAQCPEAGLHYTITVAPLPVVSIIPFRKQKMAAISVYAHDTDVQHHIPHTDDLVGAYSVTEALPVSYKKDWPDGSPTPGVCMLTLFAKKKNISHETFIDRWHNSHTPMSLRFHPLWHYNRNVVIARLNDSSAPFDGIVEEQVKTKTELLNPLKFFGPPHLIVQRMISVYRDTKSFIDYPSMEVYLTQEFIINTPVSK